jgi:uncharacterized protein (DUF924 family)
MSTSTSTPQDILTFWFERHGPADWFAANPDFDAAIRATFAETHAALARGEGFSWRSTPQGRLAEIIVLDQFSRQLHRGEAAAFASDPMALALAQEAIAGGHHHFLEPQKRMFMLMPLMHAESLVVQRESVRLFTALGLPEGLKAAEGHLDLIRRFGRFPRRNAALGRVSTPEEEVYIAAGDGMY